MLLGAWPVWLFVVSLAVWPLRRGLQLAYVLMVSIASQGKPETEKHERLILMQPFYPGSLPSKEAREHAVELRLRGNEAFAAGKFELALQFYGEALYYDPTDHLVYSNRSLCWLKLQRPIEALDDGDMCTKLAPKFAKGYLRKGKAEQTLQRRVDAKESFTRGLEQEPQNSSLHQALQELAADTGTSLQTTLYRVLYISPYLNINGLFSTLEEPHLLTPAYVEKNRQVLDAQLECLTQTLHVDGAAVFASSVLREAYDRATYACGQLLQWQPEAVCQHLKQAGKLVQGLGLAVRNGWLMHHGVAKFSANALTILAASRGADNELRREAVRLLLGGMLRWLLDPTPEPENLPEERDVCGCTSMSPRLSAATWLERLFEHGTRPWVREECERFPDAALLCVHLCLVVRDERAAPLGLPCLLRLPQVAKAVMESTVVLDLFVPSKEERERRSAVRPALAVWILSRALAALDPAPVSREVREIAGFMGIGLSDTGRSATQEPGAPDCSGDELLARKLQAEFDMEAQAVGRDAPSDSRTRALLSPPRQRTGEWLMSSLAYLIIFIDDDVLFAVQSCAALRRLASSVPGGVQRFVDGVWAGLPLLSRLSVLACRHTAALELIELLAKDSSEARAAIQSLAVALSASDSPDQETDQEDAAPAGDDQPLESSGEAGEDAGAQDEEGTEKLDSPHDDELMGGTSQDSGDDEDDLSDVPAADFDGGLPSWVEHLHELRGELGVPDTEPTSPPAVGRFFGGEFDRPGLVVMGNFTDSAQQVPVAGSITLRCEGEVLLSVRTVPAIWNPPFADVVEGPMAVDSRTLLGSKEWNAGKQGTVVLLPRSQIRRSPLSPNWAAAVRLCHEAGAQGVVVINDLQDDGPSRPPFRMGLFGMPAPPVHAFMVSGGDGARIQRLLKSASSPVVVNVASVRGEDRVPAWPIPARVMSDVAQAWSLIETVYRAAPSSELAEWLDKLAGRMGLPEKRVWLTRRLQRHHADDYESEPPLSFVECDRNGDHLEQLRQQLHDTSGVGSQDITGDFEVRFKDESSVGSAVLREWMDTVAKNAFLPAGNHLLVSYDGNKTFFPDPSAVFLNKGWQHDFELLGRLLGLAVWHQVTLDLPLHSHVCGLLLGAWPAEGERVDPEMLAQLDPELHKHKVQWVLGNSIEDAMIEIPFTDTLCGPPSREDSTETADDVEPLPETVEPRDAYEGGLLEARPLRLRRHGPTQVALVPGGEERLVTDSDKQEFVEKLAEWRLLRGVEGPIKAMLKGLQVVVPAPVLAEARRMLTPSEISGLLAGLREIDVEDWQQHTRTTGGLTDQSREVQWFWEVVREWAEQGRQDLLQNMLQFATGSRRVPVGGFAQLVGFNGGRHLFTLSRGVHLSDTALPTAHAGTCSH
eukprot:Hpha_TRINITY_DN16087_c4_g1::TRINITY_DN16087_c4_g1_i4::g.118606::m.118606/K12166/HACE1; E3 ubiquitin-protein ligase HACE1